MFILGCCAASAAGIMPSKRSSPIFAPAERVKVIFILPSRSPSSHHSAREPGRHAKRYHRLHAASTGASDYSDGSAVKRGPHPHPMEGASLHTTRGQKCGPAVLAPTTPGSITATLVPPFDRKFRDAPAEHEIEYPIEQNAGPLRRARHFR